MTTPDGPPGAGRRSDLGVEVTRELGGAGRLARGSETRFSTLKFSSRGVPRDEAPGDDEGGAMAERADVAAPATPEVADAGSAMAPEEPRPGLLGRIAGLLGLRGRRP